MERLIYYICSYILLNASLNLIMVVLNLIMVEWTWRSNSICYLYFRCLYLMISKACPDILWSVIWGSCYVSARFELKLSRAITSWYFKPLVSAHAQKGACYSILIRCPIYSRLDNLGIKVFGQWIEDTTHIYDIFLFYILKFETKSTDVIHYVNCSRVVEFDYV